ncbi:hypothetical protein EC968_009725 [Mortierella alpina]|nr:hypothetical protein EC968_009725 [Mortierella alpina]
MASRDNPLDWDSVAVKRWLEEKFDFSEETLNLFIENDIDGQVLLEELDHEALKSEIRISSFGKRCKVLQEIRSLRDLAVRAQQDQEQGQPTTTTVAPPAAAKARSVDHHDLTAQTSNSSETITRGCGTITEHQLDSIKLLDVPLRAWCGMPPDVVMTATAREPFKDIYGQRGDNFHNAWQDDTPQAVRESKQELMGRAATMSSAAQGHNNSVSGQRRVISTLSAPMPLAHGFGSNEHPPSGTIATTSTPASTSTSPVPSSSTKVLATGSKSLQRGKRTPKKIPYLADVGVSLRSIFFNKDGDAFESDSEDDWTMIASRSNAKISNAGFRSIVQRNLRRVLRDPPIFDVPGYTVYAPLRRKEHDVPVKLLSVESPDKGAKVQLSTWDAIFKDNKGKRTHGRLEVALDDQDLTHINFGAITGGVAATQSPALPQPDDFVYPAYGDSDASAYTTDEDLFKEIGREEKQRQKKVKTSVGRPSKARLTSETIRELAEKYIGERQALWLTEQAPGVQARFDIYRQLAQDKEGNTSSLQAMILQLSQQRLKSMVDAIVETSYSTTDEAWRKFMALDRTVDLLSFLEWKLDLLSGPVLTELPESGTDANTASSVGVNSKHKSSTGRPSRAISLSSADDGEEHADFEEQEEERRQAELDKAFIDDSEMQIDFEQSVLSDESQEESEFDMDGDVNMKSRKTTRHQRRTNTGRRNFSDEPQTQPGHQEKEDEASLSSLSTPPSTAATPNDTTKPRDPVTEDGLPDDRDSIADKQMINNVDKDLEAMDLVDVGENTSASTNNNECRAPGPPSTKHATVNKKFRKEREAAQQLKKAHRKQGRMPPEREKETARRMEEKKSQQTDQDRDILGSELTKLHTGSSKVEAEGANAMDDRLLNTHSDNGSSSNSESPEPDEDLPAVKIKELMVPDWRLKLKDNVQLEKELRKIRKELSLGLNITPREPYLSAYQEYIEWTELDCGDTISFREFLAWKDAGNNTKDYRLKAQEAAKVQALVDKAAARARRKEKKELDARLRKEKKDREVGARRERTNKDQKGELNAVKTEDAPSSPSPNGRSKEWSNRTSEPIVIDSDSSSDGGYTANKGTNKGKGQERSSKPTQNVSDGDTSSDNSGHMDKRSKPRSKSTRKTLDSDTSSDNVPRKRERRRLRSKPTRNVIDSDTTSDNTTHEDARRKLPSRSDRESSVNLKSDDNKRKVIESGGSNDESSGSQPRSILAFRRRVKMARHHFGDSMSEVSATEDESGSESNRPRRKGKGKKPLPMLDEAEEVLRLRKDAERNELELQKRIKEQELRGRIRASMGPLKEDEILINPGHKKTESGVAIPAFLARNLKPHQVDGIRFMWKNIVMFNNGCILAHSMGLGKTFQVVAFIYVLLREIQAGNKDIPKKLQAGRVLLLMPPTVLQNWIEEFKKWIPAEERHVIHVHRLQWYSGGGVLLMGYNMFRELNSPVKRNVSVPASVLERYRQLLLSPGPSLTFADEGHAIKGKEAKIALICKELKSDARVILTGYPLQNRLEEYWCMVDFIRPNYLGNLLTFRHNYISPIEHGLYPESTYFEKKISAKKLKVLTELIQNFVMRKDQAFLKATLPRKSELVISCMLTDMQYSLYEATLNQTIKESQKAPVGLKAPGDAPTTASKGDGLTIVIGDDSDDDAIEKEIEHEAEEALIENKDVISQHWSGDFIQQKSVDVNDVNNSNKVRILMDILKESRSIQDKVLVFTRSIPTLDYLEYVTEEAGFRSLKLDGKTPMMDRQDMIDEFNHSNNYDLFLISSGAGSQGVNLVSANRVVIFDVGWNPSHDEQAIARAYRFGQKKPVFVYRLQTHDTWESKLYKTNLHKMNLSKRVVDKKNMAKDFSKTEMKSYYKLPQPLSETPKWATEEHIEELLQAVKTDDSVLKAILDREKDVLTSILLQSDLVREEVSDLTEADLAEIDNMIAEEQLRIQGIANPTPTVPAQPVKVPLALQPVSIMDTPKPSTQPRAQVTNATHVALARAQEAALVQARLRYMANQGGTAGTVAAVSSGPRSGGPSSTAGAAPAAQGIPHPAPALPGQLDSNITPLHVPGYHSYLNYPPPPINYAPPASHLPPPVHPTPPQPGRPVGARSTTADASQSQSSGNSTEEAPTLRGFLQQLL